MMPTIGLNRLADFYQAQLDDTRPKHATMDQGMMRYEASACLYMSLLAETCRYIDQACAQT